MLNGQSYTYHPQFQGNEKWLIGCYLNLTFFDQHLIIVGVFWHTEDLMGRT